MALSELITRSTSELIQSTLSLLCIMRSHNTFCEVHMLNSHATTDLGLARTDGGPAEA